MSGDGHGHGGGHEEEEHEEHVNHEAWVIPYADLLTLLMVMFVALYAVGNADKQKFKAFAEGARAAFGGGANEAGVLDGGKSVLDGNGIGQLDGLTPASLAHQQLADAALAQKTATETARAVEQQKLKGVEKHIESALPPTLRESVGFRQEARGLVVTVVTDQLLFESGSAQIQQEGGDILAQVAAAVRDLPNQIAIEGHTDPSPIATAQFPSNWELSTGRASSVLRYLVDVAGLDPNRLTASGYADTRPIADNVAADGRAKNRRVEIVVLNSLPAAAG